MFAEAATAAVVAEAVTAPSPVQFASQPISPMASLSLPPPPPPFQLPPLPPLWPSPDDYAMETRGAFDYATEDAVANAPVAAAAAADAPVPTGEYPSLQQSQQQQSQPRPQKRKRTPSSGRAAAKVAAAAAVTNPPVDRGTARPQRACKICCNEPCARSGRTDEAIHAVLNGRATAVVQGTEAQYVHLHALLSYGEACPRNRRDLRFDAGLVVALTLAHSEVALPTALFVPARDRGDVLVHERVAHHLIAIGWVTVEGIAIVRATRESALRAISWPLYRQAHEDAEDPTRRRARQRFAPAGRARLGALSSDGATVVVAPGDVAAAATAAMTEELSKRALVSADTITALARVLRAECNLRASGSEPPTKATAAAVTGAAATTPTAPRAASQEPEVAAVAEAAAVAAATATDPRCQRVCDAMDAAAVAVTTDMAATLLGASAAISPPPSAPLSCAGADDSRGAVTSVTASVDDAPATATAAATAAAAAAATPLRAMTTAEAAATVKTAPRPLWHARVEIASRALAAALVHVAAKFSVEERVRERGFTGHLGRMPCTDDAARATSPPPLSPDGEARTTEDGVSSGSSGDGSGGGGIGRAVVRSDAIVCQYMAVE